MRNIWILAGIAALAVACTDQKSPLAPTAVAGPTPPLTPPSLPTAVPGVLALTMPVDPAASASTAFGMVPFGYHDATHATDGHDGWDIEYPIGGNVRAAAAGTVIAVEPDTRSGRSIVRIEHLVGDHYYRTVYTNLSSLAEDIAPDQAVVSGQLIGTAGSITDTAGSTPITFAMIHFQVDDLEFHREGFSSPKAVSAEPFLTAIARQQFDALWSRAAYPTELVEPFATNARPAALPITRTWLRAGGDGPAGIRFTRRALRDADYEYALLAESGTVIETGAAIVVTTARPYPTIDLVTSTSRRLGIYDVVSNEMRLSLSLPGESRSSDIATGSVYRSSR